jgi:lipoprotein-anchoring transpeptidase ErfK/SrfK
VAILEKVSSRRGKRLGDLLAVLILIGIAGFVGWLWWHQKHLSKSQKTSQSVPAKPKAASKAAPPPAASVPIPPTRPLIAKETAPSLPVEIVQPIAPAKPAKPPEPPVAGLVRVPRDVMEAQVAMVRRAISPGSIDGAIGSQTRAALAAFQRSAGVVETGSLDTNTRPLLTFSVPLLVEYVVTTNDLTRLQPLGKTWLAKSEQTALEYETILELVAEKSHSHPLLIQKLNPGVNWTNIVPGTVLKLPDVNYPPPTSKAEFIVIHLSRKFLEAFDADTNLLLHCPCSIAAKVEKRPVGSLQVKVVAPNPNYTFDPAVFPESAEAQALGRKLILQPGPNNPVGVAWIGLDRPGYGLHGTPGPEQVGRTESHGCFRLANWDAAYLLKLVTIGTPVEVVP